MEELINVIKSQQKAIVGISGTITEIFNLLNLIGESQKMISEGSLDLAKGLTQKITQTVTLLDKESQIIVSQEKRIKRLEDLEIVRGKNYEKPETN